MGRAPGAAAARRRLNSWGNAMARMSTFLNSRSMLTPGIAGAVTMMIANTLHQQFGLAPRWTALGLSFAMSLLVFTDKTVALWQRPLVYLLNGLVIFSMAVGANGTAQVVTLTPAALARGRELAPASATARPFFSDWFVADP